MKLKLMIILITAALILTQAGCAAAGGDDLMKSVDAAGWPDTADEPSGVYNESVGEFAWHLLQETMEADGNILVSAASVHLALAMTVNGADGETREAMLKAMQASGLTVDTINSESRNWIINRNNETDFELKIANSIWIRQDFPVNLDFLQTNADYFAAAARQLDFSRDDAADIINGWINDATDGKIEEVIEQINPSTVMFLINAIYFLADWQVPFDGNETRDGKFLSPDGQVTASFMNLTDELDWIANESCDGIVLPYAGGRFAMVALLPHEGTSARELASGMDNQAFADILSTKTRENGLLSMPKFEVEYESSLKPALTALGMGVAFSGGADLSLMTQNKTQGLFIGDVLHKTFIRVDEEGTEAAAVTVVEVLESAMPMPDRSLIFDRPFVYGIVDLDSGVPMFLGILDDPAS